MPKAKTPNAKTKALFILTLFEKLLAPTRLSEISTIYGHGALYLSYILSLLPKNL